MSTLAWERGAQVCGTIWKRAATVALLTVFGLALAACILMPGKFTSDIDVRKDGRFSFAYKGEIWFVSPGDSNVGKKSDAKDDVFEPQSCETASGEPRECNAAELDRQMRDWQESQDRPRNKPNSTGSNDAEQMAALMGGMDLSDPKTAAEFAAKLERQHGWRKVTYIGKGRFDVEYAITGTLTHDFTFPVMEEFPLANPFVQLMLREDGSLRINAPGYSSGPSGSPLKGIASLASMDASSKSKAPELPRIDGIFSVTTDGDILANNTEEGPMATAQGAKLMWTIDERTAVPPTALINLKR